MRPLLDLISRFRKDEGGAFAIIFAVLAIVIIAMSGAAVDFTDLQHARTRAQVALDAAALALQPTIYTASTSTIRTQAQNLLLDQLQDAGTVWAVCNSSADPAPCASVATPAVDTVNGQLTLTATLNVPMYFVNLVGVPQIKAQIISVATRKKLNLEVAMVLDNSNSMSSSFGSGTRMTSLISAAKCASNILFYGVSDCTTSTSGKTANASVKMGIVPFTQEVNVGTANASAAWMDRTGSGNITDNNFDNDDNTTTAFSGNVDRIALFAQMKDSSNKAMSWGGCVEARKAPYDTDDTTPDSSKPDTMFTPLFAPDEPGDAGANSANGDSFHNSYIDDTGGACTKAAPSCVEVLTKANCSSSTYSSCGSAATGAYTYTQLGVVTHPTSCSPSGLSPLINQVSRSTDYTKTGTTGSGNNKKNVYSDTQTTTYTSNRVLQERLCKYNGAKMNKAVSQGSVYGPNGDCPANGITPLTSTPATITAAIDAMTPQGGTNITEGAAWGLRVLSPTAPFTEGNAYNSATSKVLIIMTDGENTIYPGTNMNYDTYYSAYGFPWNNRLGSVTSDAGVLGAEMNSRLSTVCTNAKNLGITVYTIGVDVADSDPSPVVAAANQALLTSCATLPAYFFKVDNSTDMTNAFKSIANQLAALRLAR